ncbi:unnamed protein product [Linum trigynum]|uniref:Uncharacterized protein n=1 Tax=Linum trigynum TaxID=586398 RepID=A0AAV2FLT8_9ROSI
MGRAPCCDKANVKRGPWSPEEDDKLKEYIHKNGTGGNWISLPQKAGLKRCGKSCRLRWLNYLRPNIRHGEFSDDEDKIICSLYANIGSRWSIIAAQLPGRTDNDIKNYWNTKLKKKLMGLLPNSSSHHQRKLPFHHHQLTNYGPMIPSDQITMIPSSSPTMFRSSSPSLSSSSNNNSFNASAMQQQYYQQQVKEDGVLVFGTGGTEPSCSSSDGSSNNNNAEQLQIISSFHDQQQQGPAADGHYGTSFSNDQSGTWSDQIMKNNSLEEYGLEEIRQLMSASSGNNNDTNSLLLFDDNRTEERLMFY